jgi:hypothetical protein
MKIRVSEATGPALDWMVAKALGATEGYKQYEVFLWGGRPCISEHGHDVGFNPTTYWAHGGPIIEQSRIQVAPRGVGTAVWEALLQDNIFEPDGTECFQDGPTPLIAAMRCFVASRLGEEVDVPDELR